MATPRKFGSDAVAAAFDAFPAKLRPRLLALRMAILETAAATPGVGRLEETLKWGQPSYLTPETGSGSTVRLGVVKSGEAAMFLHCQSGLVGEFRALYGDRLRFEGERAIVFEASERVPDDIVRHCIALALTHHARKTKRRAG